jgi:hypothetical protein
MAVAGSAQASSIFFIRADNIWVANPNGSGAQQVTSDGSAADPYNFVSSAKEGSAPLLAFHRGTDGASNSEYGTIDPNGSGETANPHNAEMFDDEQFFTRIDNAGNRVTWAAKQNTNALSFFASSVGIEGGSPQVIYNLGGMDARDVSFGEPSGASLLFTDTGGNYYFNGKVEERPCNETDAYLPILVRQTPPPSGSNTGGSEPILYCEPDTQFYDPALSPNGQLIAAQAESNLVGSSGQIVTIPIGGSVSTPSAVSPMAQITPANSGDALPDFSPDSSEIAYQGPGETIYTVPAAGGTSTQILTSASVPAWSPYTIPTGTGGGGGGGDSTTTASAQASAHGAGATHTGATVLISCGAGAGTCVEVVQLQVAETLRGGKLVSVAAGHGPRTKHRTVVIGSVSVTLAPGQSRTVTVTLDSTGRSLLSRYHRLAVELTVKQGMRTVTSAKLTLTPPKHKR